MPRRYHRSLSWRTANRGSILPLLLVMLAIVALLVAGVVQLTDQRSQALRQQQQQWQAGADLHNTRTVVLYSLLTRPFNDAGMVVDPTIDWEAPNPLEVGDERIWTLTGKELRFDGTLYQGWGKAVFSLQDADALINLNQLVLSRTSFLRLLEQAGVTAAQGDVLLDRLLDYQDADDLLRLHGAEHEEYVRAGLPPPANRPLRHLQELRLIPGWLESGVLDQAIFRDSITLSGRGFFNINTAPKAVLYAWTAYSARDLDRLMQQRPYQQAEQITRLMGDDFPVDILSIVFLASKHFRLRLYHPDLNYYEEQFISFSKKEENGYPWVIDMVQRRSTSGTMALDTARETGLRYFNPAQLGIAPL